MRTAGVDPLDRMIHDGEIKRLLKYRTPFVLGHDVADVVPRVGSAVRAFKVGDEVYARPRGLRIGGFAEFIAIDQDDIAPKPASLTPQETAVVPLVALAAWQILVERGRVKPGQKVLVHAGAGGLGSTAVQLAKHLGATVATRRAPTSSNWCGASAPTSSTAKEDFSKVLSGYDLVLDSLGGTNLEKSLTVLRPDSLAIGVVGPPDAGFAKHLGVRYQFFFMRADGSQLREISALYDGGKLRPVIDSTFPFHRTLEAMAYVEQGRTKAGKVVVSMVDDND
ncbi:NADP-dependent oxidoreductase [Streptomyces sp. NPDC051985]|uniref:NADP-dependent oxidoreductase n=1 Tax=Streptomyces sp. NPDC051985 TaxID=3155807 RepID=UPI00343CC8B5